MEYYAHTKDGQGQESWQKLDDHLDRVAELAAGFAASFGADEWGQAAGRLHDLGKYSQAFQDRLRGGPRVDHATAGAQEAHARLGPQAGKLLAYAIAGHHGGLPDGISSSRPSLEKRLEKKDLPNYRHFPPDLVAGLTLPRPQLRTKNVPAGFRIGFFVRMVFSCLVDADYLDTERFVDPDKAAWRGGRPTLDQLHDRLQSYLLGLRAMAGDAPLNVRRNEILDACLMQAKASPGFFSLTVPTGGGKTISSLAFALGHARKHELKRIVYAIPYTSIIEQNAKVFRDILGDEAVLEHHSNLPQPEDEAQDEDAAWQRNRLAAENWDAPVVVTTNVQLFESLFANRPSRCRKLHNLAQSVIILDEAQMLPREVLLPCIEALRALVDDYGATVVMCTATQPALSDAEVFRDAAIRPRELSPNPGQLYEDFRRVELIREGPMDDAALVARLAEQDRVLCIVNTRRHARELFVKLRQKVDPEGTHHLSALMYPGHRARKLDEIRDALKKGHPCRVVSTQLVEAGVDLDFPVVWRALAGIDSIAQAAGRCNREGFLDEKGRVHVFEPEDGKLPPSLRAPAEEARDVLRNCEDALSLEAVARFFANLFWRQEGLLDSKKIVTLMDEGWTKGNIPFAEVARNFGLFDNPGEAVLVCPDMTLREKIIAGLTYGSTPGLYLRQAQPYTVQLYPHELDLLEKAGDLIRVGEGMFPVLTNLSLYDDDLGLVSDRSGWLDPEKSIF